MKLLGELPKLVYEAKNLLKDEPSLPIHVRGQVGGERASRALKKNYPLEESRFMKIKTKLKQMVETAENAAKAEDSNKAHQAWPRRDGWAYRACLL